MIAGARDVAVSPAIVGAFPRKEAALVEVPSPSNFCCNLLPNLDLAINFNRKEKYILNATSDLNFDEYGSFTDYCRN